MSTPKGTRCVKIAVSQHEAVHIYSNAEGITLELRRESRSVARWRASPGGSKSGPVALIHAPAAAARNTRSAAEGNIMPTAADATERGRLASGRRSWVIFH